MFYKRLFYKYPKNIYNQAIFGEKNKYILSRKIVTFYNPGGGGGNNNDIFIISLIVGFFILFKNKSY